MRETRDARKSGVVWLMARDLSFLPHVTSFIFPEVGVELRLCQLRPLNFFSLLQSELDCSNWRLMRRFLVISTHHVQNWRRYMWELRKLCYR